MSRWWAKILGIAGLIPFAALCAATLMADPEVAGPARHALLAWGAVIAAFLGGIAWGTAVHHDQPRLYALSTVPFLAAWAALLLPPEPGLWLLIAAFIFALLNDRAVFRRGLVPAWFYRLRRALSLAVIGMLGMVALLAWPQF